MSNTYWNGNGTYQGIIDKLSEEIFEEWSLSDPNAPAFTSGNPVEFKTLNLSKFIKNLTAVANNEFQSTLIASVALNFNLIK